MYRKYVSYVMFFMLYVMSCHMASCLSTRANIIANLLVSSSLGYFLLIELIWLAERAYPEMDALSLESKSHVLVYLPYAK